MPVAAALEEKVAGALRRAGLWDRGAVVVAGVSGGPDSSALLHSLNRLRDRHSFNLHVAHLNHDFRGVEADEDAEHVAAISRELGINAVIERWDPEEFRRDYPGRSGSSFEELAREMRYLFLARTARALGAAAVAVGHTSDDQAETVLLHLLRGAGLHGIAGMAETSPWPWPSEGEGVVLFRPLLGVGKADTSAYCRELGVTYREDSGNLLMRFTRVRVRRELLPLLEAGYNSKVRSSLVRLAGTAALALDFLEGEAQRAWADIALELDGAAYLDLKVLTGIHPALQRLVLRRAYEEVKGDTRGLQEDHLRRLAALALEGRSGNAVELPKGIKAERTYGHLVFYQGQDLPCPMPPLESEHSISVPARPGETTVTEASGWLVKVRFGGPGSAAPPVATEARTDSLWKELPWRGQQWQAGLAAQAVRDGLSLRNRRPGDRWQPKGMAGGKKLQDFFVDCHTPRAWRDRVPILATPRGIAAVAGHRVAEWAAAGTGSSAEGAVWVTLEIAGSAS